MSRIERINEKLRLFDCHISVARRYGNSFDYPVVVVEVIPNHKEIYTLTFIKREGVLRGDIEISQPEPNSNRNKLERKHIEEQFVFRMFAILDIMSERLN